MSARTAGVWAAQFSGSGGDYSNPADVYEVIADGRVRVAENLHPADARLIAAAPELLAALEACVAQLAIITGQVHDERSALIKGCAAIAKATGEQA